MSDDSAAFNIMDNEFEDDLAINTPLKQAYSFYFEHHTSNPLVIDKGSVKDGAIFIDMGR